MGKITILGGGNGGCAYAAYLGKRGHQVCLYEIPELAENLKAPSEQGGFEMEGEDTGWGPVTKFTTDIQEAVEFADYILAVVPAFAHKNLAKLSAPYLKAGQTVVLNPGSVLGAVEFLKVLRENGNHEDVTVGETSSNIFAVRKYPPNRVQFTGIKKVMHVACIPADRTEKVVEDLHEFFPMYVAVPNVLYTSFMDLNAFVHPVGMIFCASRIELGKRDDERFDFYFGSVASEGVCRNMEAIDEERQAIARGLGFEIGELYEGVIQQYYPHPEWPDVHVFFQNSRVHGGHPGAINPPTTHSRYLTEDLPYGLVPLSDLGKLVGVATPHMDGIITLCSTFNDEDYREIGRSLKNLGLEGMTPERLVQFITEGK